MMESKIKVWAKLGAMVVVLGLIGFGLDHFLSRHGIVRGILMGVSTVLVVDYFGFRGYFRWKSTGV